MVYLALHSAQLFCLFLPCSFWCCLLQLSINRQSI